MWEITIFVLVQVAVCLKASLLRNEGMSKVYLKVDNVSYNFFSEETC